jgi:HK97 family phage major capsid protein
MSDPTEIVNKINASIEAMKTDNAAITAKLQESTEGNSAEIKAALKVAEELSNKVTANAQAIVEMEQKLAANVMAGKASPKTLGDVVIASEGFKNFAAGGTQKFRMDVQANTITGQSGSPAENSDVIAAPQRLAGIVPGAFRNLRVADVLPSINVTTNAVEYTRELLFTNAAAETSEGVDKPESTLTFELVTTNIRTIATFLKASKQILEDAPALKGYIDTRLRYAADYRKEVQIVAGNGTNPNISGMLDSGNHTGFTPITGENGLDSLNRAQALVATAEYEANAYMMNPADWHALERLKVGTSDDRYIIGNPLGVIGRVLWGLPVILSNSITPGKFLVGNFDIAYTVAERMGTVVEMFEQDEDNVQKNLLTIRAENRCALLSNRPASVRAGNLIA